MSITSPSVSKYLAPLVALAAMASGAPARADSRSFMRAYEYATQPQGNLEFELWNDVIVPRAAPESDTILRQKVELEYGITDHWDVSLYHAFTMGGGEHSPFAFDGWQLETRLRLADRNVWPVDVMLYFELERPSDFAEAWEAEEKIIVGKDFGRFGVVVNLVSEQSLSGSPEPHGEVDLGLRYEIVPNFRAGLEAWGRWGNPDADQPVGYFAGPSFRVSTHRLWLQFGAGVEVQHASTIYGRSVIGFNL